MIHAASSDDGSVSGNNVFPVRRNRPRSRGPLRYCVPTKTLLQGPDSENSKLASAKATLAPSLFIALAVSSKLVIPTPAVVYGPPVKMRVPLIQSPTS